MCQVLCYSKRPMFMMKGGGVKHKKKNKEKEKRNYRSAKNGRIFCF